MNNLKTRRPENDAKSSLVYSSLQRHCVFAMHELLSNTDADDPKIPPSEQEFWELRLYESDSAGEPVYCVREARALWNDESNQHVWDEPEIQAFATLQEAKSRYSEIRQALAKLGFIHSDMDLL